MCVTASRGKATVAVIRSDQDVARLAAEHAPAGAGVTGAVSTGMNTSCGTTGTGATAGSATGAGNAGGGGLGDAGGGGLSKGSGGGGACQCLATSVS